MARLNEILPSVESVDALKRRFVRQNREIARANSTQSLRIRNLEGEVSRLLSENIGLREQIIKLEHELQKDPGRSLQDNVDLVKGSIEAKLAELDRLVQELGNVQKRDDDQSPQKKHIVRASPRRSPDQRNWKNALTLSEVTGGMDGRLPPIVEDKYYPRRTLDAEEMLGILGDPAHTPESPDLGPPPIAHFDDGDPVKADADHLKSVRTEPRASENGIPDILPAHLETRRKRRESTKHSEIRRPESDTTAPLHSSDGTMHESHQPLKSGAKRKLSARDDDERAGGLNIEHGFSFTGRHEILTDSNNGVSKDDRMRPKELLSRKISENLVPDGQTAEKVKDDPITNNPSIRKVLAPKSVNTDPVLSPLRAGKGFVKYKGLESEKDTSKKSRDRKEERNYPVNVRVVPLKVSEPVIASIDLPSHVSALPPETPIPPSLDLFSPISSEPSAARPESKDTPPPEDLNSTASNTGSFGRSSRRPRGSVSYAEPNLRHKMRRPTKNLVDAVGAEERHLQASSSKEEEEEHQAGHLDPRPGGKSTVRTVFIKKEVASDSIPGWKTLSTKSEDAQQKARAQARSPLGDKVSSITAELPSSVLTDRRGRMSSLQKSSDPMITGKEGSRSAIAALIAASKKPEPKIGDKDKEDTGEAKDIYEITRSSPADDTGKDTVISSRTSRRHSTVSGTAWQRSGRNSAEPEAAKSTAELIAKSKERREAGLKNARSTAGMKGGVEGGRTVGRAERAASRRRSMML